MFGPPPTFGIDPNTQLKNKLNIKATLKVKVKKRKEETKDELKEHEPTKGEGRTRTR